MFGASSTRIARSRRGLGLIVAAFATCCGLVPAAAAADPYPVYACVSGSGNVNHALSFSENTNHISQALWCGNAGIQVWSNNSVTGGQAGGWWFHAPPGTTITNLATDGKFSAWGGWVSHWATNENGTGDPVTRQNCTGGSWCGDCQATSCNGTVSQISAFPVANSTEIGFGIWCDAASCPPNDGSSYYGPAASANVYDATITVNDPSPPGWGNSQGSLTSHPQWVSNANAPVGGWTLVNSARDPGGVCSFDISVASEHYNNTITPDYSSATPCAQGGGTTAGGALALAPCSLPGGQYTISESASNPAGMVSYGPDNGQTIGVDCTPPTVAFSNGPDQSKWYRTAQTIQVSAQDQPGLSGVKDITCALGGQVSTYSASQAQITVQPTGGQLTCHAEDNAGNVSATQAWNFLIDNTPPTGHFEAADPQNPTLVAAQLADTGSGVAGAQIELETLSGWQPLPTSYDASTGVATATIPDNGTLPNGIYNVEVLATDVAGNQATITQSAGAGPEQVALPLRSVTQLLVGGSSRIVTSCRLRPHVVRLTRGRKAKRAAWPGRKCAQVKVPIGRKAALRYGQRESTQGLLQTAGGTPVANQPIAILQQAPGWGPQTA
ncbi:MAG: Ig-like domain repeat protein, partial [Terriglobales bacterium]